MSSITQTLSSIVFRKHLQKIKRFKSEPIEVQNAIFKDLINRGADTVWGQKHNYSSFSTVNDFRESVPLNTYEDLEPYFQEIMSGKQNLLWPETIQWFSKSSGTTTGKSKFIPVSKETLFGCHYDAGRAMVANYIENRSNTKLLTGKNISVSGSYLQEVNDSNQYLVGDISAILMQNLPKWAEYIKIPSKKLTLISDWEEKINMIAEAVVNRNVVSFLGVPSWMLVILRKIEEVSGKSIDETWPNLEVFFHGGVDFGPYKDRYNKLIKNPNMRYLGVYNASEGYFAFQDDLDSEDLLLLLDYGIYYEFVPLDMLSEGSHYAIGLEDVKLGENYAMVISTNSGLWRYVIGDTVKFTSLNPFKIKITGRTKAFINIVGEELILNNANKAIGVACKKTDAVLSDYTVAPKFYKEGNTAHEWLIEFEKEPDNMELFEKYLDEALMDENSDYKAKRFHDMVLRAPVIDVVPQGTFYKWFKSKNKLGGQNKLRRLSNNRNIVDEVLLMLQNS
ncbi:GH3 auxin-responsive promoter family protein [Odoribacter sp. OttesenSCG-928-L07]|nr:GH3 auxin-responsive promoter family protein [Odoribacter sp. OttesenSCG-928-L07]MDL2238734.1 GH3 auxin-responsive promoter family protein [Bacteroidales bacterium OttesenSCG-928-L14]MDL2241123.1 GH3 auxin-responsive promoter family protein [Bacteroidales bacterium OttesenSCG-928-K22]